MAWRGGQYLFYVMYYFVLILFGLVVEPMASGLAKRAGINRCSAPYRAMRICRTLLIVFVGELFFRATSLDAGFAMFGRLIGNFTLETLLSDSLFAVGMPLEGFVAVGVFMVVVLVHDILAERGAQTLASPSARPAFVRWAVATLLFASIVIFGAYGVGYVPVDPMYAQF